MMVRAPRGSSGRSVELSDVIPQGDDALAVRCPANHALARGGNGVDLEGHLLSLVDLGGNRRSLDRLCPVVLTGFVLDVELLDRQRNRPGRLGDR